MDITADIIASFRASYVQFIDDSEYPDAVLIAALEQGDFYTQGCSWTGDITDHLSTKRQGMFLYAAHWLTVTYPKGNPATTAPSSVTGGVVSGKSVGDESISYAVNASANVGDDWLRTTGYGQQFLRLSKSFCVGFFG